MSDDKVDRFIDEAAGEYNRPPARVPREEMWARIERTRTRQPGTDPKVVPLAPTPRRTQWITIAGAIAAALLIGVLLGRAWDRGTPGLADNAPRPNPPGLERQASPDTAVSPTVLPDEPLIAQARAGTPAPGSSPLAVAPDADAPEGRSEISYEVATMNHLAQMEALLTTFRAVNRDGQVDGQLAKWARDMLSTTRLLLDSPAAEEAKNRRLLEDLELVLVQIVNLAPNAGAADRGSIERTLENGQVMTRLRTAVPAGGMPRGT